MAVVAVDDPGGALVPAASWVQSLLGGSIATTVAVVAVAALGFAMMMGRVPARRAGTVVLGCFIVFSASSIARGIVGSMSASPVTTETVAASPAYTPATPPPLPYDPYAGASVPQRGAESLPQMK